MQLQVGDLFDEFRVVRRLGAGAFSEVFLAHDRVLERQIVLKQLSPKLSQNDLEWNAFVNEAQVTASFFHPGIVTVHGLRMDASGESAVLVLEYMDGGTLRDLLRANGALDFDLVWRLCYQVGNALTYLHTRGVIHRDIKPENILYSRETGWFKISDFGLAYHPERSEFEILNEGHPGTPAYMSPEQTSSSDVLTERSDLYTFVAVLYEALTGHYYLPMDPDHVEREVLFEAIRGLAPAELPVLNCTPALVDHLESVLLKGLAKHPLRRYPTVRRFTRAFTRTIENIELELETNDALTLD
ncbi:MAG: serine/threonine protein kinase [Anaerolineae bacterium]|nr:serine/threonine protein kinase [Anaerolineae bacterium]